MSPLQNKKILHLIGGSIAAYKSLDVIRRLKDQGASVTAVMTKGACAFITPLAVGTLTAQRVYTDLFDREAEQDVGHIRLAREADALLIAPATAHLLAKMTCGLADDLASTLLLATHLPVFIAPAMNPSMWHHPATQHNVTCLRARGHIFCDPAYGEMAESEESGIGRLQEPYRIIEQLTDYFRQRDVLSSQPLRGMRILVTSGPTQESLDSVRYLSNRSSGRQGHALAQVFGEAGAQVHLVTGPVNMPDPPGVTCHHVISASEMLTVVESLLPVDCALFAAAVSDWRPEKCFSGKYKKKKGQSVLPLTFIQNPDILACVGRHKTHRPELVIGFAAEADNLIGHAQKKRAQKGADWILANDISVVGKQETAIVFISEDQVAHWPLMSKKDVGHRLVALIAEKRSVSGA